MWNDTKSAIRSARLQPEVPPPQVQEATKSRSAPKSASCRAFRTSPGRRPVPSRETCSVTFRLLPPWKSVLQRAGYTLLPSLSSPQWAQDSVFRMGSKLNLIFPTPDALGAQKVETAVSHPHTDTLRYAQSCTSEPRLTFPSLFIVSLSSCGGAWREDKVPS